VLAGNPAGTHAYSVEGKLRPVRAAIGRTTVRNTIFVLGMTVVLAASAAARGLDVGYEPDGFDELKKQKGVFKTTLVKPRTDFSRYRSIETRVPVLFVLAPAPTAQTTGSLVSHADETVVPETEQLASFKELFSSAIASEIEQTTDFDVVESSDAPRLVLQPIVTEAEFTTSSRVRNEEGEEVPILSRATVVFDLMDSETGEILARLGERRKVKPVRGAQDASEEWPVTRAWLEAAAHDLCNELARLQQVSAG
jgi:hypothetical protein